MDRKVWICLTAVCLIIIPIGCASGERDTQEGLPSAFYMHLYRPDSYKAQPELILAESDGLNVETMYEGIKNAVPGVLPSTGSINKLYVLQFEFTAGRKHQKTEYYMYAETSSGTYVKPFKMEPNYDLDKYTESDKAMLIQQIGVGEWLKPSVHVLIWSNDNS